MKPRWVLLALMLIAVVTAPGQSPPQAVPKSDGAHSSISVSPPATPTTTPTPGSLPARVELSGGAEVRILQETPKVPPPNATPPLSIVLYAPPPATPAPSNNLGLQGGSHDPSNWSIFVDGSAAIFGVLSAIIAITILCLALRGMHDYRALKSQLVTEVQRDVTAQVVDKLIKDALAGLAARLNTEAADLQKRILEQAEKRLGDETLKLADEMAQRDEFRNEVSQRVAALLHPAPKTTTPDEFDEPPSAT